MSVQRLFFLLGTRITMISMTTIGYQHGLLDAVAYGAEKRSHPSEQIGTLLVLSVPTL